MLRMLTRELQQMGLYRQSLSIRHYKPPIAAPAREEGTPKSEPTPPHPPSTSLSLASSGTTSPGISPALLLRILNHPVPFDALDVASITNDLARLTHLMGSLLPVAPVLISQVQPIPSDITTIEANPNYVKLSTEESGYYQEVYSTFCPCLLPLPRWNGHNYTNPVRDTIVIYLGAYPVVLAAVLAVGARLKGNENISAHYLATVGSMAKSQHQSTLTLKDFELLIVALVFLALAAAHLYPAVLNWQGSLSSVSRYMLKSPTVEHLKVLVLFKWLIFASDATLAQPPLLGALSGIAASYCAREKAILEEWGLLLTSGFNLITGTSQELVQLHKILLDFLAEGANQIDYRNGLKLISGYVRELNRSLYPQSIGIGIDNSPWVSRINGTIVSWVDISHQAHVHALIAWLLVAVYGVAWTLPQVQKVLGQIIKQVDQIITSIEGVLGPLFKAPIAIRWPILVACSHINDLELRSRGHEYLESCRRLSTLKEIE